MSCDFFAVSASRLCERNQQTDEAQSEARKEGRGSGIQLGPIETEIEGTAKNVSFYEMTVFHPRNRILTSERDDSWGKAALAELSRAEQSRACTNSTNLSWLAALDLLIDSNSSHLSNRCLNQILVTALSHTVRGERRTKKRSMANIFHDGGYHLEFHEEESIAGRQARKRCFEALVSQVAEASTQMISTFLSLSTCCQLVPPRFHFSLK